MNQTPRITNPELIEFFSKRKKGEQVTGAKYYKRVEIGQGKYRYYYTKDEYDQAVKQETEEKEKKSVISIFKNFFGFQSEKQASERIKADHSEFSASSPNVKITEDQFSKYSLEYFKNKLSLDKFFSGKKAASAGPSSAVNSAGTSAPAESSVKVPAKEAVAGGPAKPSKIDLEKKAKFSVFKFLNKKYGNQEKAEQTAQTDSVISGSLGSAEPVPQVSVSSISETAYQKTEEKIQENRQAEEENKIRVRASEKIETVSIKKQHEINQKVRDLLASKTDDQMTDEDKALLAKYEGDGGQTTNNNQDKIGKGLLYEFYTPQPMIDKTWDLIKGYFKSGDNILEPSAGIGKWAKNISGLKMDMLEIDQTSSRIAKILNPDHNVKNMPFEKMFLDKNNRSVKEYKGKQYAGAVGNPPYGAMTGEFKGSEGKGWKRYENYFLKRSLDTVEEGGIVAMVVPSSFLQKDANDPEKKRVMEGCELLDAYRFPEGAFSNTKIGTDLVILRKNTTGTQNNIKAFGGRFFEDNPEKILGETKTRKNRFGKEENYVEGDASKFLEITPGAPVEMSQAHKDAIAAGLVGNDNAAKGTAGVTRKERRNRDASKKASENHRITDAVAAAKSEPREVFDQNAFNEKYQKQFDELDSRLVTQTNTLGYITDFSGIPTDPKKICYIDGQYMPHYLYTTGNIKEKLFKLEADKADIVEKHGEEFFNVQKSLLEAAYPKTIPLKDITLSPLDAFSRTFTFKNLETAENYVDGILGKAKVVTETLSVHIGRGQFANKNIKINSYTDRLGYAVVDENVRILRKSTDGKWVTLSMAKNVLEAKKSISLISKEDWNFDTMPDDVRERVSSALTAVQENDYSKLDIPDEQKERLKLSEDEVTVSEEEGLGETLQNRFFEYIKNLDSDNFEGYSAGRYDLMDYCKGTAVTGSDAKDNQRRRKDRAILAERLYAQFISEELTDAEKDQLERGWNDSFNASVDIDPKKVPIKIEGLSKTFKGREYKIRDVQTQFVSKFIQKGVGCAAHQVGVGKTMSGIIATVSNMQMGRAKKPVIVVPSSVLQKWEYEFKELYPGVPLNTLGTKQLNDMLAKKGKVEIEEGSVTVMSYDAFERFSFSEKRFGELTRDLQDQMENPDKPAKDDGKRKKAQDAEKAAAVAGKAKIDTDSRLLFDEAGFDHITVDEAHNFNNIFTDAKTTNSGRREANEFEGITGGRTSTRGMKLWLASRHVLEKNNNRNILLLTATPFTNNPLQVYSLISLMAKERLQDMGINNIREFIAAFVETGTEYALEANGEVKEKKTVRSFKNAKAFRKLINEFFDYKTGEDAGVNRPDLNRKSVLLPPTAEMVQMRSELESLFDLKGSDGKPVPGAALKSIGTQQIMNISPALVRSTTMGDDAQSMASPEEMAGKVTDSILGAVDKAKDEDDFLNKIQSAYKKIYALGDKDAIRDFRMTVFGDAETTTKELAFKFYNESKKTVKDQIAQRKEEAKKAAENRSTPSGGYGNQFVERSPKVRFALDSIAKFYNDFQTAKPGTPVPGQICFLPRGVEFTNEMKNYLINTHKIPAEAIGIMTPKEKTDKAKDPVKKENGISRFSEMTEDFNDENGKLKIIIGSDVIKEGVDLNGNTAVAYNLMTSWNPTDEQQKLGRAWRQGNKQKNVHFVDVQIEDSIDSKLYQKQAEKASRINDIFSDSGSSAIDVSDVNPDELKLDVVTDPFRKAKLAVEQENAKAQIDRQEKQAKLLSMQSALEDYHKIKNEIKSAEEQVEYYSGKMEEYKADNPDDYADAWEYENYKSRLDRYKKEKQSAKNRFETAEKKMDKYRLPKSDTPDSAQKILDNMQEDLDKAREIESANKDEKFEKLHEKYKKEKQESDKRKAESGKNTMESIVAAHVKEILDSVINYAKSMLFKNRIESRFEFLKSAMKWRQ